MKQIRISVGIASFIIGAVACSQEVAPTSAPAESTDNVASAVSTCVHPICASGVALASTCDPCATNLCARDPYCCSVMWDSTCVSEVPSICGLSCTAPPPPDAGPTTCSHPICSTGVALTSGCDPCATKLCAQDSYCCLATWDATCVGEVASICGTTCQ